MSDLDTDAAFDDDALAARVGELLGGDAVDVAALDGGMVGRVRRVELADGRRAVAKTGDTPLSVEARMLRHLATESPLPVPEVYAASDDLLVMEYVEGESTVTPAVERDLADRLAALHDAPADSFGFPFDTLTGPLAQPNPRTDSWVDFFRDRRLLLAAERAADAGALPAALLARVRELAADLDDLLGEPAAPSPIHGDVWRTNVLTDGERVRAFLDPACYWADPEVELAYADWTDTVGDAFFERYDERRGLREGFFRRRRFVYRLYPLLVHVHLFGDPYPDELAATLDRLGY